MSQKKLSELRGVGKAVLSDLKLLGIETIDRLALADPEELYQRLCDLTHQRHCICVLDVFYAIIAQAKDPNLSKEMCEWFYWSRRRKAGDLEAFEAIGNV